MLLTMALLTVRPLAGLAADQSTPEEVVERALDALNHGRLEPFLRAIHPDALNEVRTMVHEVLEVATKQGMEAKFVGSFPGVKDASALKALDAPGLLTVMLNKVTAEPEMKKLLATTKVDALGRIVTPAKDRAYVVYRTRSKFGELDIVRLYAASLLKSGLEWKMTLPDDLAGRFGSMKQEVAGGKARPDFEKTRVEPLGHVMDGKSTALVVYRSSLPVGDSAVTTLGVASVDVRDAAWDAVLKDDAPAVTAFLDRKLGLGRARTPVVADVPPEESKADKARVATKARIDANVAKNRERMKTEMDERNAAIKANNEALAARKAEDEAASRAEAAAPPPVAVAPPPRVARAPRNETSKAPGRAAPVGAPDGLVDLPPTFFGGDRDRFHDVAPTGGVLVGVRISTITKMGGPKVSSVQPIYRVGEKQVDGKRYGTLLGKEARAVARAGYAVGGLNTHTGLTVDGFALVFMKVDGDRLDTADSYNSPWLGDERGGSPRNVESGGKVPVGLQGRSAKEVNALGLIVKGDEEAR